MIETLRVRNFKALREVEVPLRPFTVLIGPNDSGKSSILQALAVLGQCHDGRVNNALETFTGRLSASSFESLPLLIGPEPGRVVYRSDRARTIELGVRGTSPASESFHYQIELSVDGRFGGVVDETASFDEHRLIYRTPEAELPWNLQTSKQTMRFQTPIRSIPLLAEGYPEDVSLLAPLISALSSQMVCFRPEVLAEPCDLGAARYGLNAQGYGLAAVLDALLTGPDRSVIQRLEEQLHKVVPTIRGVALVTTEIPSGEGSRTGKALELVLTGNHQGPAVTIPADQASQGTILAAGYLALVYSNTARCLLVEEPENGLHPSALGFIVDLLKKVSRGELGPGPRQVILTTHSPLLLNFVEPEDVLIVTRTDDNVRVTPMVETPHFAERFQDFDLGELWYNVGEDNLVKKS